MGWRVLLGTLLLPAAGLAGGGSGCARTEQGTGGSGSCEQMNMAVQDLEGQARSLAVAEGCSEVSQCGSAAVGAMACGGPRDYVVYCRATTDEATLLEKLSRLQKNEDRYNKQCGIMSICIFIDEPQVELVNGVCQKAGAGPVEPP